MCSPCEIPMDAYDKNIRVADTCKKITDTPIAKGNPKVVKKEPEEEIEPCFHFNVEKTIQKLKNLSLFSVAWWEHRASGAWHTGNLLVLDSKSTLAPYEEALADIPQAAVGILWASGEDSGTFWKLDDGSRLGLGELCSESIVTKLDLIRMKQDPLFLPLSHHVAFHNAVLGLVSLHTPVEPNVIDVGLKSPPFRWRSMTAPGTESSKPTLLTTSSATASVSRLLSLFGDISGTKLPDATTLKAKQNDEAQVPKTPNLSSLLFSPKDVTPGNGPYTFTFAPASLLAQYFSLLRAPSRSFLETDYSSNSIIHQKLPHKRTNSGFPKYIPLSPSKGGSKEALQRSNSNIPNTINPHHTDQEEILGNQFTHDKKVRMTSQSELPVLDMKTRVFGVSFDRSKRNWEASWADTRTGKRVKKCFSEGRWGLQAREKAVAARREAEQLGHVSHGLRNYSGLQQS